MLSPEEIVTASTMIALAIAQDKNVEQLNILSAVYTQIGDTLATYSVQKSNINNMPNAPSDNSIPIP